MTEERLEQIFEEVNSKWEGDNAFEGLCIIRKYIKEDDVLCGADHDVIYSVTVPEILAAGLTEDDAQKLAMLNWSISEGYFSCFV